MKEAVKRTRVRHECWESWLYDRALRIEANERRLSIHVVITKHSRLSLLLFVSRGAQDTTNDHHDLAFKNAYTG